ncbi:gliding motility-associated C-terminal domain-containing protein [Flavobacterium sp. W1B]|uniref:DUF7507 domain-containing protein n=1 Tax=Flavobacterium sp. W1B TaxID=3394146 RepID=UPI0039BD384C
MKSIFTHSTKLFTFFLIIFSIFTTVTLAQTFPPASSCTSKDLSLAGASLSGGDLCNSCPVATSINRTLTLSIDNTTGSTRTSFAFWGTLEEYSGNDGSLISSTSITGCVGPLPGNTITNLASNSITYTCGNILKITNLYLAWTDASPNSTCPLNPSTISPKCGTLPSLTINSGVNGEFVTSNPSCFGTADGSINLTPTGGTSPYNFSWTATDGGIVPSGQVNNQNLTNLVAGTYSVTITDTNGCTIIKSRTITNPAAPDPPISGGNQTVCTDGTLTQTLTATATGGTITWYTAATGGTLVANPTQVGVGTSTYYAQASNGTCSSLIRTAVTLTINTAPSAPISGGNQTVCTDGTLTQTLTATATGGTITWYTAAIGGSLVANPTQVGVGTSTYYAQASNGTCPSLTRTAVTLTINPAPNAPISGGNQTVCTDGTLTQTLTATATGGTITWYAAATGGSPIANPTQVGVGTSTYYAQASNGTCPSLTRTAVTLTINPAPNPPTSGGNQTVCTDGTLTQTLTATVTGGTITWYTAAIGGSLVANPTQVGVGTSTYYAQASNGTCPSLTRTAVTLTINPAPNAPISGGNQTVCTDGTLTQTLTATATGGTITWYTAAIGGALVANPIQVGVGTSTYYAQASNGTCSSLTRTAVTLTINLAPNTPISGGNQTVCTDGTLTQTLTATATGGTITWYTAATGGSPIANPTQVGVGTSTYYAQASNGNCSSLTRTAVTLTINPAPSAPISGGNQTVCTDGTLNQTLTATATGGTITWYTAAIGGSLVANPTQVGVGTSTYYAQASNGTCLSLTRTPVVLTINTASNPPTSGGNQNVCSDGTLTQTLTATATGGTIIWYTAATGGTLITDPTQVGVGTSTYYAQASNGTCSSLTRTAVTLTINAAPNAPISSGNIAECKNPSIQTLTAIASVPQGQYIVWYDKDTGGTVVQNPILDTVGTITYYAESVYNSTSCPSLTRTAVTLTIHICSIAITKDGNYEDSNNDGITNVGDKVIYNFVVTNTGTATLTNVTVTDNNAVVSGGPIATLEVGASDSTTFTATHDISQEDINAAIVYNLATATGTPPIGDPVSATSTDPTPCTTCPVKEGCPDCTITTLEQNPSIAITKDGTYQDTNQDGITNIGDKVIYNFVVTNTGNVTLTNVTVTDNNAVVSGGPIATLEVGASDSTTFTATHDISQEDINAAIVYNLATATGTPPIGEPISATSTDPTPCTTCPIKEDCPDCTITTLEQNPSIAITKDGTYQDTNQDGITNIGDKVIYSFIVTNTGNVTLTNVTVTDNNAVVSGGPIATLEVGSSDSTTFTATHDISQEDINAAIVYNLATATGTPPIGEPISATSTDPTPCTTCPVKEDCPNCTITTLEQNPSIAITKDGTYQDTNQDGITNIGDKVIYNFVVTNTGNVTLTNITVTDINAVVSGGPIATLEVGTSDSTTFTATHDISQEDINAAIVYNLATATGTPPIGEPISATSTDPTPCTTCPVKEDCPDCTITTLEQNPSIAITKDGTYQDTNQDGITNIGDKVIYNFVVTNTGNVTLTNITVTDNNAVVSGGPIATLEVGASDSTTFTATHDISQEDINAAIVYNLATATGTPPIGEPISATSTDPTPCTTCPIKEDCPDCTITTLEQNPSIAITKDGTYQDTNQDGITNIGDKVIYNFVVTNTGNVTLTNITVTDNNAVVSGGPITSLQAGASDSTTFTAVHNITQEDINAAIVYNLATATGTPPVGNPVTATSTDPTPCTTCPVKEDCPDCTITEIPQNPILEVIKTATVTSHNTITDVYSFVGDVINYTIIVKNTGNVAINNIIVKDPLTGLDTTNNSFNLSAGESKEFNQTHTITKEDLANDSITNIATADGVSPRGTPISASDTVIVEKAGVLGCESILVHNAFSPNGDGINENFVIDGIDDTICYPENTVEIYNRWGVLVFETKNYNNQTNAFDGYSRGRTTISKSSGLPTGTYYYILNYTSVDLNGNIQTNKKDGYLYLTR